MPYRMPNGRWRAHRMIDGRRKTKVFDGKREAITWENAQSLDYWTQAETRSVTVLEWANRYLDHSKERFVRKTYEEKCRAFRVLTSRVGEGLPAEALTSVMVLRTLGSLAQRSGSVANRARKNLRAAWAWGVRYLGLPKDNPFAEVERYPEERLERYVPPMADLEKVLDNETGENRVLLLTFLHTAARRGEVLRLRWSDIDFERSTITLRTRKRVGGSLEADLVPMTLELGETLLAHKKQARSVYVFCDEAGQPYKVRRSLMSRICRRAGVKPFGFHAIRHLTASVLAAAGIDLPRIQGILRHKSITTTARYIRTLIADNPLEEVFGKKKAPDLAAQG